MKKWIALALVCVVALSLCACGGKIDGKTQEKLEGTITVYQGEYEVSADVPAGKYVVDAGEAAKITVWVNWGRDQAQILNRLIQSSFSAEKDYQVDVKISNATVIQGVLSGNGPDVILQQTRTEPVNLALRGVLYDLSTFDDCEEVLNRFVDGAVVDMDVLLAAKIVRKPMDGLKVLGNGELTKKLTVKAAVFSATAKAKIEAAGGQVEEG